MADYADPWTLAEARHRYFERNGFGDGGYTKRWVKLQAGPVPLYFPNTAARVRAVRLHDLHHVVTGYDTTWLGEAEIAAWEIASGCGTHYAAWLLNLQAMAIGLAIDPGSVRRAFVRGRYTRNLYTNHELDEATLTTTVGALRQTLALDRDPPPPTLADRARFVSWSLAAVGTILITAAPLLALLWAAASASR